MQVDGLGTFMTGTKWAKPRLKNTLIISWYLASLQTCTKHCLKGFAHLSLVHRLIPFQTAWPIALHLVVSHAHNVNCVPAPVNERDPSRFLFMDIKPNQQQRLFPYDQGFNLRYCCSIRLCRNLDFGGHNLSQTKPPQTNLQRLVFFVPNNLVDLKLLD